jgi:hypothetical protein
MTEPHPYPIGTAVSFSIEEIFDIEGYVYDHVGAPTEELPDRDFVKDGWYFVISDTGLWEVPVDEIRTRTPTPLLPTRKTIEGND